MLQSDWGRLFHNWENATATAEGFTDIGEPPTSVVKKTMELLKMGVGVFGTAAKEAPEVRSFLKRK